MVNVVSVRFEHHQPPALGIGECEPRISWSFEGDDRDWMQLSYELELRRDDKPPENYLVPSSDCQLVSWPSRPLHSQERAVVRVRVTGSSGIVSGWSESAEVEVGLLDRGDWQCSLIEPAGGYAATLPHCPVILRQFFNLRTPISTARLYITAHGIYSAQINGEQVGDHVLAPGWTSYKHRLIYQTYDVTALLRQGQNHVHIDLAEGWYCGRLGLLGGHSNNYGTRVGVIAMLVIQHEDGEETVLGTDNEWRWATGPIRSSEIYNGEVYDARVQPSESAWDVVRSWPVPDAITTPVGPPVRRTIEIQPREILKSRSGRTILDIGQNMVGWLRVRVNGPSGTLISFQFAEVLEHGEVATRTLRHAKCNDSLILAGNPITWEPKFTYHGFRYVEITGWPGELRLEDITGIVVHSDMRRTGHFACSNPLLNRLHENVIWSVRGNFVSIPTDCPQRDERLGWTGDINVFGNTANLLFDTAGMLLSWLKDVVLEQTAANGVVPLVVPNIIDGFADEAHAVWGDVAVMLPWSLFNTTGDVSILTQHYSSMKAWLEAIPRRSNGLWNYTAEWKLGDWLDPAAPLEDAGNATTDPTMVSDAFLVHITRIMSDTSDASQFAKAAGDEYITPAGLLAADTQTAFALAIQFSLFPTRAQEQRAASRLKQLVLEKSRFKIATGFAGTPYIGYSLTKTGQSNLFYRMLLHRENPSWLYPVTMGATTIWERWDSMLPDGSVNPGDMTSFNHYALGAVASWMYNVILGVKAAEPGWRAFHIEPIPGGGLRWAEGSYLSAYGNITVRWEIKDNNKLFWIRVLVPPNTTAKVRLPGTEEVKFVGSGTFEWEAPYEAEEWPPRAIYPPMMTPADELPVDEYI
ncbi:bacterial alpha-L-rhamnosidase domain protein [Phaeosphaeriaceae sp. PMI808]|nr:bacterial alpha-L-rhamnosidase domain protein [Phaeosphaeriaceae sp. PMI808]